MSRLYAQNCLKQLPLRKERLAFYQRVTKTVCLGKGLILFIKCNCSQIKQPPIKVIP